MGRKADLRARIRSIEEQMQYNVDRVQAAHATINDAEKRLKEQQGELRRVQAELNGPIWVSHTTETWTHVGRMSDGHLRNAIKCMLRKDHRYTYNEERMLMFAELIAEAEERELDWRS